MMDSIFNLEKFHISTTEELKSTQNRVRNLIGRSNWGEDGRYKEAILKNMIKRFISPRYTVGTGFIVKNVNEELKSSSQIDILIFDSSYPTLFSEGDFYIVTPNSVKATIEVKTDISNQSLKETIRKVNNLGDFLDKNQRPFVGIFSFNGEYSPERLENTIKRGIIDGIENECFLNHISINDDIFIKYWPREDLFSVYNIKKFSFSFFISNLIHFISDSNIDNELSIWFPIQKESRKLFDIRID
jgi:hypothetical protein